MAARTPRFGLNRYGNGADGSLSDDGGKFTGTDRQIIDKLLAAYETHTHSGGQRLDDPSDAPGLTLDTAGGSLEGGTTYYYTVTYVDQFGLETAYGDEASVATPAVVARPGNPGLSAVSGGTLAPGLYQYALTAHKGAGETTLSGVTTITVSDFQTVEVSFVAPAGSDNISIWRQGPTEPEFTRIDTVGVGLSPYTDDGSIPADPCACDPENLPPATNTTGSTARVTITAPLGDLTQPTLAERWRIYRTTNSGAYSSTSLLADIADTTVEGGDQLVETYLDDGTVALQPGQPPLTSRTLLPSQEAGGGGSGGGMVLLYEAVGGGNDKLWQVFVTDGGALRTEVFLSEVEFGPDLSLFASEGIKLTSEGDVEWRMSISDGVLFTTDTLVDGEPSFTFGRGPDLQTSDARTFFRLGVLDDGTLVTYGDRVPEDDSAVMRVVRHGSNGTRARPDYDAVYWIGSAEPENALPGDLWFNTDDSTLNVVELTPDASGVGGSPVGSGAVGS